ncbi:hypothetical protein ACFLU8_02860 [Chloroflexota bacterium]
MPTHIHADLPAGFADVSFLIQQNFNFAHLVDDLAGECDFLTMIYPLYFQFQSNIITGLVFGGQAIPYAEASNTKPQISSIPFSPYG